MGVDVGRKGLVPLEPRVGNPTVLQSEALQGPGPAGQLPVHLHGRLVQDLCEEAGSSGDCGHRQDRHRSHDGPPSKQPLGGEQEDAPPPLVVATTVLDCWLPPTAE